MFTKLYTKVILQKIINAALEYIKIKNCGPPFIQCLIDIRKVEQEGFRFLLKVSKSFEVRTVKIKMSSVWHSSVFLEIA